MRADSPYAQMPLVIHLGAIACCVRPSIRSVKESGVFMHNTGLVCRVEYFNGKL